jgi:hypothetical protein
MLKNINLKNNSTTKTDVSSTNLPVKNDIEPIPNINLAESFTESLKESVKTNPAVAIGIATMSLIKVIYKKK